MAPTDNQIMPPRYAHPPLSPTLVVLITVLSIPAFADSPAPPTSYKKLTPDQKYVFVMLSPFAPDREAGRLIEPYASDVRTIRETYPNSGLYPNDGSTTPLWTVDWYA